MPVYRDERDPSKWVCKVNYKDYTGKSTQKKKRGFKTKKEAQEWEHNFMLKEKGDPDMTFRDFCDIYLEDAQRRLKPASFNIKEICISAYILPFFGNLKISDITPLTVKHWQNDYLSSIKKRYTGKPLSPGTIKNIERHLSAIFAHGVKFYNFPGNPVSVAGSSVKTSKQAFEIWTPQEFNRFIERVTDPMYKTLFNVLYFTGVRIGEALALTPQDIDFKNNIIHITKTRSKVNGSETITPPKTPKSIRDIPIPEKLKNLLEGFILSLYDVSENDFIFPYCRYHVGLLLKRYANKAGIKPIRIHDLRHSHASLLIDMGFNVVTIAERLGHENISMTLNTYSHLFPHNQNDIVDKLNDFL